jgi:1,4-alpha-glucan branching enzyme
VRQFIRDNAMMWLEEYRVDGLRMDMTLYIRSVRADGEPNLPDGWSLIQWINREVQEKYPGRITVAEDLQNNEFLTKKPHEGGAGYSAQWDARFVHPIREAVIMPEDQHRSMAKVADAVQFKYNGDAFQRVIYSESHDEVANGKARVPQEINPGDPTGWYAQKRSTLAAALVFTSPGIPMLFQGQEFLEGEWFRDTVPVDWHHQEEFRGIVRMYRDLIGLRLNKKGMTRGLCGQHVQIMHCNDVQNVITFKRWDQGGPNDEVIVVANFSSQAYEQYQVGFTMPGEWKLIFNSDWKGYSKDFNNYPSTDVNAVEPGYDNQPYHAMVNLGPYAVLMYVKLG